METSSKLYDWSLIEIEHWLSSIGFNHDLISKFNENNITGQVLPYLNDNHLKELEIPLRDRIQLKIQINKLLDDQGCLNPLYENQLTNVLININDLIISNVESSTRLINDEFYKLKDELSKSQKPLPTPEKNPSSPFNLASPTKISKLSSSSSSSLSSTASTSTSTPTSSITQSNSPKELSKRRSLDLKSKSQRNSTVLPNLPSPTTTSSTTTTSTTTTAPIKPVSEPLKQLRASTDDPCSKILQAAMKRHKLNDDWRNYALVICYGDRERILELDEKPVQIFKELRDKGEHPAIMLRQKSDYIDTNGAPGGKL